MVAAVRPLIEARNTVFSTELFRKFLGIQVTQDRTSAITQYYALSAREGGNPTVGACPMQVYLDQVPLPTPFPTAKATVSPPLVSRLPNASSASNVTTTLLPAETDAGTMVSFDCAELTRAGVMVTLGRAEVRAMALIVAVTIPVPGMVPVNVAV